MDGRSLPSVASARSGDPVSVAAIVATPRSVATAQPRSATLTAESWPPGRSAGEVLDGAAQDVAQRALVRDRKRGDGRRRLAHQLEDAVAQLGSRRREHERLDAAVAFGASPLDEATRLEPVGDAGDVGGVAEETLRER